MAVYAIVIVVAMLIVRQRILRDMAVDEPDESDAQAVENQDGAVSP